VRGFLLDSNVISELRRPAPSSTVRAFLAEQPEDLLFISEVTYAEIRFGIERLGDAGRRAELDAWLNHTLRPYFGARVLGVTEDVLLRWRLLLEAGRRGGHTFAQFDLLIAALAADNDLIVVSRDMTHFVAAGVAILDPWAARYVSAAGSEQVVAGLDSPHLLRRLSGQ